LCLCLKVILSCQDCQNDVSIQSTDYSVKQPESQISHAHAQITTKYNNDTISEVTWHKDEFLKQNDSKTSSFNSNSVESVKLAWSSYTDRLI